MSGPARIAILPDGVPTLPAPRDLLTEAVTSAGGMLVPVEQAEAVVWTSWQDPDGLRDMLAAAPGVRWIQLVTAGVDRMLPLMDASRAWTSAKGCYSRPIAEYAVGGLVAGMRGLPNYARSRTWRPEPARSLLGANVTILGAGGIARALIDLLTAFGCVITVVRQSPDLVVGAARTVTADRLAEALAGADVVLVAAALTPRTQGILDATAFAALPPGAWLVNVGRGAHVITDALVGALRSGQLGGAVLDVTDPEPLPADHPLWSFDNCLITPHVSCPSEMAAPYLLRRVGENVRRFADGRTLEGVVDAGAGY